MSDKPNNAKEILQEAVRQLYERSSRQRETGNSYLQGGDGQFLGNINQNKYDRDSILNRYGPYGSNYSPTSIHNQYSKYGSPYSQLSINSAYASNPPILFLNGERRGVVSKNRYLTNRIATDIFMHLLEHDIQDLLRGRIPDRISPTTARAYLEAADGTFLGSLERNRFVQDSIFNHFSPYGSRFSPTSIFNRFGNYGSQFSPLSPYNIFTTTPPTIVIDGQPSAYLTKNSFVAGEKVDPDRLEQWLTAHGL